LHLILRIPDEIVENKEIEFVQKLCINCSEGCTYCIEACPSDEKEYTHVKSRFEKMNAKLIEKKNKNINNL